MSTTVSRRTALAGFAGLAASPFAFSWFSRESKPVGWAILGLGGYATNQIMPAFAHCERSKIVALISGHAEKLSRYGDQYGVSAANRFLYSAMDEIKNHPEIEVVYVITPPATHPEFTIRAANLGKHVCSEKPMAPTVEDCKRMIDACRRERRLLQIGYRCHYENHNLRAIQACRSKEFGKIVSLSSDHGFDIGHGQWRTQKALAGGGSMMDIGIYSLNALRYLSGEEPVEVKATIKSPANDDRFVDCEDDVAFHLKFPSGLVARGGSGYSWNPGKNRFEVQFEHGTMLGEPATYYVGHKLTVDGKDLDVKVNDQFATQVDHFSQCVREHKAVATPGEEGLRDIRIIQAIYRSGASGGDWVRV